MRKMNVIFLVLALVSLTGCAGVVSLHPLATPDDRRVSFDPALVGTWEEVEANPDGTRMRYVVAGAPSGYAVTAGPNQVKCTMQLLKVGDRQLLDVYFPHDGPQVPVHVFCKLRMEKDAAWLAEMTSDWLMEQIKASGRVRHELLNEEMGSLSGGSKRILLIASTVELQSSFLPYVADDRSFVEETELRRIK
jgi:hypothetical protein